MLHHEQAGFGHLDHAAVLGNVARRSPYHHRAAKGCNAEMNSTTLDRRRNARQRAWVERQGSFEHQRLFGVSGSEEGERDPWLVTFFSPQAGPKRGFDELSDLIRLRQRRQPVFTVTPRSL